MTTIERTEASSRYKQGMRHLAGAISVITADFQGQRSGLTVTSVSSVSVDPPELLVCINVEASAWPLIEKSGRFGVNVLHAEQEALALRFAGAGGVKGEQRYETAPWSQHQGVWLLDEAAVAFACEVEEIVMCHSHAVVVARVLQIQATEGAAPAPLLYWQGQFGTLQTRIA